MISQDEIPWSGPALTTARPSMADWFERAGITRLNQVSTSYDVETALVRLREILPPNLDTLSCETLGVEVRRVLRAQHAPHNAGMIDAALERRLWIDDTPAPVSQATLLLQLAQDAGVECFHDDEQSYLQVPVDNHSETYQLRSRTGRAWLQRLFYQATKKCAGGQAIADATNGLEASALAGPEHRVHVRIGSAADNAIYLDLGGPSWGVVEICPTGWRVISQSPIRFRRPKGFLPLPAPRAGGSITDLRRFVNVADDDMFVILVAGLVAMLRGRGPYPGIAFFGESGTGKSTTAKALKTLIDPSTSPLRSPPRDEHDLVIAAANSHVLAYENVSTLPTWLSDGLCRLATGAGFSTRTLYENREEEIFQAARPVMVNGIPEFITKPDLVSRYLLNYLPVIADESRLEERLFWPAFEEAHPGILGALCDIVVTALARQADVQLTQKPRMADFAVWIVAAEPACPWKAGAFMEAYAGNRHQASEATLEGDPLADLVFALTEQSAWRGTPTKLLAELNNHTKDELKGKDWFKRARQVSDALRRLAPDLRVMGIDVTRTKGPGRRRERLIDLRRHGDRTPVDLEQLGDSASASSASSAKAESIDASCGRSQATGSSASSAGSSADSSNVFKGADAADAADAVLPLCSNEQPSGADEHF